MREYLIRVAFRLFFIALFGAIIAGVRYYV